MVKAFVLKGKTDEKINSEVYDVFDDIVYVDRFTGDPANAELNAAPSAERKVDTRAREGRRRESGGRTISQIIWKD